MQGTDPFEYFRGISSPFSIFDYVGLHTFSKKLLLGLIKMKKIALIIRNYVKTSILKGDLLQLFLLLGWGSLAHLSNSWVRGEGACTVLRFH